MRRLLFTSVALAAAGVLRPAAAGAAEGTPPPRVSLLFVKSPLRAVEDAARSSLQERQPELLACYQRELARQPDPEATVTMSFTLQESGSVSMPEAVFLEPREDPEGDRLLECLTARAATWTFPAPEGGVAAVSVGLVFSTRPGPALAEATAAAAGSIDRESLRTVLRAHAGEIQRCYEQELARDHLLEGQVTLRWTVQPNGSVTDAGVDEAGTTLRNRKVQDCMLARVGGWRFPRPKGGGPAVIRNPWVLSRDVR
jgi:hypothetical protein